MNWLFVTLTVFILIACVLLILVVTALPATS